MVSSSVTGVMHEIVVWITDKPRHIGWVMIRRDQVYWQRLRKDKRSALAVGFALLACLMALLALLGLLVPGPQAQARGNPLYWLCILPFVWWASGLGAYEPRFVRMMRPMLVIAVASALICLSIAMRQGEEFLIWIIGTGVAVIAAGLSEYFYRSSLLFRDGPAR